MTLSRWLWIVLISWSTVGFSAHSYVIEQKSHHCDIVIVNDGHLDLQVYGILDNGVAMKPFKMSAAESTHYIDLYDFNHFCHEGMSLYILSSKGKSLYSAYTEVNSTIHLIPIVP